MIYIDSNNNLNLSKLHDNQKAFVKSEYLHTGIVGGYQCLPGHTEYLTTEGWKSISNYNNEEILVYNLITNKTKFEKPAEYINQKGSDFIKFTTDRFNMEVTPNHKVIYNTEKIKDYRISIAATLKKRVKIPRTFVAPDIKGVDLTDNQIRIQVMISADGSLYNKTGVRINVKKDRKKERLLRLLANEDINYSIIKGTVGYLMLSFIPTIHTKDLSFLFKANPSQLKVIADECRYWDGHVYGCGSVEVCGTDKRSMDLIQYAITTTGSATSLLITDKREYKSGDMYNVREFKHNFSGLRYCTKEYTYHDRQYCFTVSTGFFIVRQNGNIFITGNSGKSSAAVIKVITHLLRFPGVPIAYYLPIFRLFDDMLIPKIKELLELIDISYKINQHKGKIVTPYGEVWMRSMDTPDSIVSYSVGYSLVDEVDLVHPNKRDHAMKRISSRNSYKKDTPNQIDFVSTPEGFAYMYKFFEKNANENKILLRLKTSDNAINLSSGYIQGLREQYTDDQLKAYLDGEFVNLTSGTIYYKFDRQANHLDKIHGKYDTLSIGMDFNVGNMSGVVHIIESKPIAIDELVHIYDTGQMINIIKEKYPDNRIIVYPDASGKNRSTNATTTDIQMLKDAGFAVKARNSNPIVKDRIKNMNRMFCNGVGEVGYSVNVHKCPEYTEALERMSYDRNGQPDKSSGFDHVTDAGGYFIWYEYPLATKKEINDYYSSIEIS